MNSANAVQASSNDYVKKACNRDLYNYSRNTPFIASDTEFHDVYASGTRANGPGRGFYNYLFRDHSNNMCTLCWKREVESLDHYLPKFKYPELSVVPSNLIPACKRCNEPPRKGQHIPTTYGNQLIHPYFDDYTAYRWLFGVTSVVNGETTIKLKIRIPCVWPQREFHRLKFHFDTLNLWDLYEAEAVAKMREIINTIDSIIATLSFSDRRSFNVKKYLLLEATKEKVNNLNSWKTATYCALANSSQFLKKWP